MSLADFFAAISPFLLGRRGHSETARLLYGDPPTDEASARRLAIYGRFCRNHRFEVVDSVYPHTRQAVVGGGGEAAWARLVEDYFVAHPMWHVELNANGRAFAPFLAEVAPRAGLPPWLPELADLEWWELQVAVAPDAPEDLDAAGPLRLGSTVELRRYGHDLLAWLADGGEAAPPSPGEHLVLFWRDRDLDPRREPASLLELSVLKAVSEGVPLGGPLAAQVGATVEELGATVADLHAAGILCGPAPAARP